MDLRIKAVVQQRREWWKNRHTSNQYKTRHKRCAVMSSPWLLRKGWENWEPGQAAYCEAVELHISLGGQSLLSTLFETRVYFLLFVAAGYLAFEPPGFSCLFRSVITASLFSPFAGFVGVLGNSSSGPPAWASTLPAEPSPGTYILFLASTVPWIHYLWAPRPLIKNNLRAKFINLLMNSPGGSQVLPPPSHTPDALRQCCFVSVLTQP